MGSPQIFISYTTRDEYGRKFAIELQQILHEKDFDVFLFDHSKEEHLGADLWYLLAEQIEKRQILLVVCTSAINQSRGVRFEIGQALQRSKLVVPLKFADAPVPEPIVIYIRQRFDEDNYKSIFASVARGLPKSYAEHNQNMDNMKKEGERFARKPPVAPKPVTTPKGGDRLLDSIVKAYYRDSVIEHMSNVERFDISLHSSLSFGQIGLRVPITKVWIDDPSHYILVDDFGRSVTFAERNYLVGLWRKHVQTETFPKSRFILKEFQGILNRLSSGMNPKVLLAPIDMFVEYMSMVRSSGPFKFWPIRWKEGESFFALEDGKELKMLWSNMYAPLDSFVLVDPSATRWCVKPDPVTEERLTAVFVEDEKEPGTKIDFLVKTEVSVEVVDSRRVRMFKFESEDK